MSDSMQTDTYTDGVTSTIAQNTSPDSAGQHADHIKRRVGGSVSVNSHIINIGEEYTCLESTILISEDYEMVPNEEIEQGESKGDIYREFDPTTIKTDLASLSNVMIVVDVSDFATDYLPSVRDGVGGLINHMHQYGVNTNTNMRAPVVFCWNEYFESRNPTNCDTATNLELINGIGKGAVSRGKSNFVLMMDCLRESLEFSRGKFAIVVISAGNDNVNESNAIFRGLENLRAVVDKQHVDIHCVGIGGQHDMIILDNLARMATGRGTYQTASTSITITDCISILWREICTPSVRINFSIMGMGASDSTPDTHATPKLYRANVDRSTTIYTVDPNNVSSTVSDITKITARMFGKVSSFKSAEIKLILAGGEYQQTGDFTPADRNITVTLDESAQANRVDNIHLILTKLKHIRLQLDAITNCLKYEMSENTLREFRNELTVHGSALQALNIKDMINGFDLVELKFVNDLFVYFSLLSSMYEQDLVNSSGGGGDDNDEKKGVVSVSMEDYSKITALAFSCEIGSLATLDDNALITLAEFDSSHTLADVKCITYTHKNGTIRVSGVIDLATYIRCKLFPDLVACIGLPPVQFYVYPVMLRGEYYTILHKYFPDRFSTSSETYLRLLAVDNHPSDISELLFNHCPQFEKSVNNAVIQLSGMQTMPYEAFERSDLFKASLHDIPNPDVAMFIGAINYVSGRLSVERGVERANEFKTRCYKRAALFAYKRALKKEFAQIASVKLCEILVVTLGVREDLYKGKLDAVRANTSHANKKHLELQAQAAIIEEMKKRGFKYIKPQGKRTVGASGKSGATNDKANATRKITPEEMKKYTTALISFITTRFLDAGKEFGAIFHTAYTEWISDPGANGERLTAFARHYSDLFSSVDDSIITERNTVSADMVNKVIQHYISDEKKKIMQEGERADRNEKIMAFVTTDRVYAAAGLLRGAYLGVNLSKYLGTLCEAAFAREFKVPLLEEKLSMIISGRLITDSKTGRVLCKNSFDTLDNSLLLVEDMPLHIRQEPFTYDDMIKAREIADKTTRDKFPKLYSPAPLLHTTGIKEDHIRGLMHFYINKYAVEEKRVNFGYWKLGAKKSRLVRRMLGGLIDEDKLNRLLASPQ